MTNKTVLIEIQVNIADDFLNQASLYKNINAIGLNLGNAVGQTIILQPNIPYSWPGSNSSLTTVIVPDQPIQVSAMLNGIAVTLPTSISPIVLPGPVTNLVLSSTNTTPTDVYLLQGA